MLDKSVVVVIAVVVVVVQVVQVVGVVVAVVGVVVERPDGDVSAGQFGRRRRRRFLIDRSLDAVATPLESSVERRLTREIKVPAHLLLVLDGGQLAFQAPVVDVVNVVEEASSDR